MSGDAGYTKGLRAEFTDVPYAELGESWVVDGPLGGICTMDGPHDTREAYARLFASAPALLEALEEAARTFRQYEQLHLEKGTVDGAQKAAANAAKAKRMEAAIAAATGRE